MQYIYKQKLKLSDLVNISSEYKRVLIVEPEDHMAALYAYYLRSNNYHTQQCQEVENMHLHAKGFKPHAIVLNIDSFPEFSRVSSFLRILKKDYPYLRIVTTAYNLKSDHLSQLMSMDISAHFDRKLGRPQDIVHILQTIFQY